jgi:ferredoxin-NAD(P)+ reductase (naphthalene dioxygenase ferredoxin-specific)
LTALPDPISPAAPRLYEARVISVDEIAGDTRIIRADIGAPSPHRAGQYAHLSAAGFDARPYSIANAPDGGLLEFHIKNTGRGLTAHIFESWRAGSAISVEAPLGDHFWRASTRPLLALAGGVGIAPIKAILEAHFAHAQHSPAYLYWGVRDAQHLYLDQAFRALQKNYPEFRYVPLLGEPATDSTHRTGYIAPALAEDFKTLAGHNIYIAGPAPMINATLPALDALGAEKDGLFSDSFGG